MVHKIYLVLFALAVAGGGFFYIKNLGTIEAERDQYEAATAFMAERMATVSIELNEEVEAYKQANQILNQQFQAARDSRDRANKRISQVDFQDRGKSDPAGLERDINKFVDWVFTEIKTASVSASVRNSKPSITPAP